MRDLDPQNVVTIINRLIEMSQWTDSHKTTMNGDLTLYYHYNFKIINKKYIKRNLYAFFLLNICKIRCVFAP